MTDSLMVTLTLLFLSVLCSLLLVFLLVNIWQRQRAEEALRNAYSQLELKSALSMAKFRDSEARFHLIAEAVCDLLYEYDLHTAELTWFGDIDAALGFAQGEFPHTLDAWQTRIHPEDQEHMFERQLRKRQHGDTLYAEYRIQTQQGEWRYWQDYSTALFDDEGQPRKLLGACNDVTVLRLNEQKLRSNEAKYRQLIESLGAEYFFYRHGTDGVFSYISPSIKHILGYSQAEFLFHYAKFFTDNPINQAAEKCSQRSIQGLKQAPYEIEIYHKNGERRRLRVTEFPIFSDDGQVEAVQGIAQDISQPYQIQQIQQGRTNILEMIAQAQPLPTILHAIINFLESAQSDMLASIMLFDAEHNSLSVGAAPSLPDFYNAAVDGIKITDGVGSCGTAIYRRERVITEDLLSHPYWADFRDLIAKTPLRSCWSEPVFSSSGQVLGTFALYYRTPRLPSETEHDLIQAALHLASIAIDQHNHLQAVQESEKRLSILIESLPDAIYFKDGEGRWQVVNSAGLQAFNLQGAEWRNKTELELAALQPPALKEAHHACFASDERAWQHGKISQLMEEVIDANGEQHYFDVTKVPLFTPQGEREGLVIIGRNVTQQKQLEATLRDNQRYLQAALNASGAGTFLYDVVTDTNYWDERSLAMFGVSAHEFASNYAAWLQCLHPEDRPQVESLFQQALREQESIDLEYRVLHPDHSIRHIKAQAWVLRDSHHQVSKISGLHFDITQSKQTETELKQARDHAEAASRAKSAFLATMSHELRTPLNSILGYAHILQQAPDLNDAQREQLLSIQQNGQHLLMLINNVLDLSKIEVGKIELQPNDFLLAAFFQEIAHYFTLSAAEKQLEFTYESEICADSISFPALVRADEKRLRQVLFNLLNNAVKFTRYGYVRLSVKYVCDHSMSILIEDSGCGIAQQDLDLIFLPFQQLNSEDYQSGTGLGLSIANKLLQLMEAELKVESELGKGSRFFFTMPLTILSWEKNHVPVQEALDALEPSSPHTVTISVPQLRPTVMKTLCGMAALGDVTALLDYATQLQTQASAQEQDFYAHIIDLTQSFKIDELQTFLQKACNVSFNQST